MSEATRRILAEPELRQSHGPGPIWGPVSFWLSRRWDIH